MTDTQPNLVGYQDHYPHMPGDMFPTKRTPRSYVDHYPQSGDIHTTRNYINSYLDHKAKSGDLFAGGITRPSQASDAGFEQLIFNDEFDVLDVGYGTSGHKWNAGQWWETVPATHCFQVADSVLTLTTDPVTSPNGVNLCTQYHDASGGIAFMGGYFEARMLCHDWSAFWLYDWKRPVGNPVLPSDPMTWSNEIDIIETDPGSPSQAWCTLHKNTSSSGGVPDAQNNPDNFPMPSGHTINEWHVYGVLWTQTQIAWYIDNVLVASVPPYASTWQLATLILGVGPGGVNGGASDVTPPYMQVDWVRVWG